ncbi:Ribonuclease VapC [uncultured Desulfobacterium sp.]|uniref:Ribonuclease VapC n=1 Tax=uncultured Desulfobacterium sp. TaxID=201089 RepID=A0A445MUL7_9BACT|nr:Ribonuclease VapC [uncultured Desulfobacterium sp.]
MKRKRVLDSYAMLAYLNKEKGFDSVRQALSDAQSSGINILMNQINVGETFYILYRKRGKDKANYFLETILAGLPIVHVANTFDLVIEAALIKAGYPISFADCFSVCTAARENAVIMTGDPEFRRVEHLVDIEWI